MSHSGRNRLLLSIISLALVAGPAIAQTPAGTPKASVPETPVGRIVTEWLAIFNAADSIKLGEYYRKYRLDRNLPAQLNRARQSGGFDVVSIEKSQPRYIEMVLKERATGTLAYGVLELTDESAGPLTFRQSYVSSVPPNGSIDDFRIGAADRARVIEAAIAKLDSFYVFPDVPANYYVNVHNSRFPGGAVRAQLER